MEAMTSESPRVLGEATLAELRTRMLGSVISPGDSGYENARRIWNGAIDMHPRLFCAVPESPTSSAGSSSPAVKGCRWRSAAGRTALPGSPPATAASCSIFRRWRRCAWTRATGGHSRRAARPGGDSTTRPRRTAWPPRAAWFLDRDRRVHAGRRHRAPRPQARTDSRQPAVRRDGDRRRRAVAGEPRRER